MAVFQTQAASKTTVIFIIIYTLIESRRWRSVIIILFQKESVVSGTLTFGKYSDLVRCIHN